MTILLRLGTAAITAAVVVSTGTVGAGAAPARVGPVVAPAALSAPSAVPSGLIRRACTDGTAGRICVNLYGTGRASAYRVVYQLLPAAGQWIRPLSKATWLATSSHNAPWQAGPEGTGFGTRYAPFCAAGCAAATRAVTYTVDSPYFAVYTMIVDTPQGHREVSAGVTPVASDSAQGCDLQLTATEQLSSTADGNVHVLRSAFQRGLHDLSFTEEQLYVGDQRVLYRRAGDNLTTPTYVALWGRVTNGSGDWRTLFVLGHSHDHEGYTITSAIGPLPPC